jgi:hypothetical protein
VGTVVLVEHVVVVVESELAVGDTIADAAGAATEVLVGIGLVAGHVIKAEDDIVEEAGAIGHSHRDESGAVIRHVDLHLAG